MAMGGRTTARYLETPIWGFADTSDVGRRILRVAQHVMAAVLSGLIGPPVSRFATDNQWGWFSTEFHERIAEILERVRGYKRLCPVEPSAT